MLTLFDYPPSRNAWKVRQLLRQLDLPYRTKVVDILQGEGQHAGYRRINPTGKVPAIELEDGRTLAESNAILAYLAEGSAYLPAAHFERAKVSQWMSFEQEQVESSIGTLRYWVHAGMLSSCAAELVESKRTTARRALAILDVELATRAFIVGDHYTIADISLFAYATCAENVGIALESYPNFRAWTTQVEAQHGFLLAPP
jgi:glutathione S-transferase